MKIPFGSEITIALYHDGKEVDYIGYKRLVVEKNQNLTVTFPISGSACCYVDGFTINDGKIQPIKEGRVLLLYGDILTLKLHWEIKREHIWL